MVPVSWQMGSELSRARPMLQPTTSRARSAFDPFSSLLRAVAMALTTSSGRIVEVRRMSSRMLSKRTVRGVTSWRGAVAVIGGSGRECIDQGPDVKDGNHAGVAQTFLSRPYHVAARAGRNAFATRETA